jgi:ABC-type lipoprotein export system ATPase subunit
MSSRAPNVTELPRLRAAERVLEVSDLKKSFVSPEGEHRTVVDVAHFELRECSQVALHGHSGCGKTTFLNMLAGIVRPDSGKVVVQGAEISELPESKRDRLRAATIGYVHQNFNLLQAFSALENVLLAMSFGLGTDQARARALLERVGLGSRLTYRPKQLSTGQQQRVAVARALANRPQLVLADEPTGNLDPKSAGDVLGLLKEACSEQGAALLLVTHDRGILSEFDCVQEFAKLGSARGGPK